jgi:probable RNA-binding protein EIF1AD
VAVQQHTARGSLTAAERNAEAAPLIRKIILPQSTSWQPSYATRLVTFTQLSLHGMAPPRRKVLATAEGTMFPPDELSETQQIVRAIKATGNNIYLIEQADKTQMLVELPARFRSTFWIKRGAFLVVDTQAQEERDNKIGGEIINIVRDEKTWRKAAFWYDHVNIMALMD